ncbi:hypothetical protein GCM10010270_58980 [Streptomyces violaceus]|nr:hypothetical protein GCM10010270_58980 [Streptomyces janthinus]
MVQKGRAERPVGGRIFLHPLPSVLQESRPVHQDRLRVREGPAQPVKDGEAVGVRIAPAGKAYVVGPVPRSMLRRYGCPRSA